MIKHGIIRSLYSHVGDAKLAKKTFRYASIEPSLLLNATPDQASRTQTNLVLSATEAAPEGANRDTLKSRIYRQYDSPHAAFGAFSAVHDIDITRETYADLMEDLDDEDRMRSLVFIERKSFEIYEHLGTGGLYFTSQDAYLRRMFRRYRDNTGDHARVLTRRVVDLAELERRIPELDINGYRLEEVPGDTPLDTYEVSGSNIARNADVQAAKQNAKKFRAFSFKQGNGSQPLNIKVTRDGIVTFCDYPGDRLGLEILSRLEQHILICSDSSRVNIR